MNTGPRNQHAIVRPSWLETRLEEVIDPNQIIVDAHHHLYDRPGLRYLLDEMLADVSTGHNVRTTVYVQARSMLRKTGPEQWKTLGETEFANGIAAMSASGSYGQARLCQGIVGAVDLHLGARVREVLQAHISAAGGACIEGGRFRGIRQSVAWDIDTSLLNPAYRVSEDMLANRGFREGFAQLAPLGLSFDAWLFFHQISQLTLLAREYPDTSIVLNHCGGILGSGRYKGCSDEVYQHWSSSLRELAKEPNVMIKLGGLGMRMCGMSFDNDPRAPSSQQLAERWRPWLETCIEYFGPERCMFESNFPVDKGNHSYLVGWNAMKRVVNGASSSEKDDLFWRSASRFYRIPPDSITNP